MAIGWLTVLKMVPWGDVIENAPKVAQGAKKLWNTVGQKPVPQATSDSPQVVVPGQSTPGGQEAMLVALQAQVADLQMTTADLHQQMLQSSALIQSLAEQNTQLIGRVELNRKRTLLLFVLLLVLAASLFFIYI
jgi:hypothetical protein